MNALELDNSRYKIGAVARLTGIPVETLRVWERRYQVVTPQRAAGGSRLYDRHDVARLMVIKRLIDGGDAISTIARLPLVQLEQRESTSGRLVSAARTGGPAAIAIIGSTLPLRLSESLESEHSSVVRVAHRYDDIRQFEEERSPGVLDGLIIEVPVLIDDTVARLRKLQRTVPGARLVVVYGYGKRKSIEQLQSPGVTTLRYPITWPELIKALDLGKGVPAHAATNNDDANIFASAWPSRRFDDGQLARFASLTTDLNCECPNHLAELVVALHRFELYSAECENSSDEDAALHAYLHRVTAQARSLMESALQRALEVDGIDPDDMIDHSHTMTQG